MHCIWPSFGGAVVDSVLIPVYVKRSIEGMQGYVMMSSFELCFTNMDTGEHIYDSIS